MAHKVRIKTSVAVHFWAALTHIPSLKLTAKLIRFILFYFLLFKYAVFLHIFLHFKFQLFSFSLQHLEFSLIHFLALLPFYHFLLLAFVAPLLSQRACCILTVLLLYPCFNVVVQDHILDDISATTTTQLSTTILVYSTKHPRKAAWPLPSRWVVYDFTVKLLVCVCMCSTCCVKF